MEFDLVFEGGGAKGLVFVGALQSLEKHGHTIDRLIGTSAGSIMATLLAAGYNSQECLQAVNERLEDGRPRFSSFMDTPTILKDKTIQDSLNFWLRTELDNPYIPNLLEPMADKIVDNLLETAGFRHLISFFLWGGWYSGDVLLNWVREKLDAGGRDLGYSTLWEFHEKTGRDLSLVASDVTGKEMLILNHRTAPDLPIAWAVRMSMSVPFAWQEVTWQPEWGHYRRREVTGHRVVDGGLLSNFPIQLLVSKDEFVDEIMGNADTSENVLGLLIDESVEVPGAGDPPGKPGGMADLLERIDLLAEVIWRIRGLADTMLAAHDRLVQDKFENVVVRLPAKGYGTLEFDMSDQRIEAILIAGETAMDAYFAAPPAKHEIPELAVAVRNNGKPA